MKIPANIIIIFTSINIFEGKMKKFYTKRNGLLGALVIAGLTIAITNLPEDNTSEIKDALIQKEQINTPTNEEIMELNSYYKSTATILKQLSIKGRASKTGYTRAEFGQRWADVDHNGCDTRNDILQRDLKNITYKTQTQNCVVLSGTFTDPYNGKIQTFNRQNAQNTPIDHVVALSDAWQKGAQQLPFSEREKLANDPLNLVVTNQKDNSQKGDSDAASWLPPNKKYRCKYVATQIAVKYKYGLWVTPAEYDALQRVLKTCPKN